MKRLLQELLIKEGNTASVHLVLAVALLQVLRPDGQLMHKRVTCSPSRHLDAAAHEERRILAAHLLASMSPSWASSHHLPMLIERKPASLSLKLVSHRASDQPRVLVEYQKQHVPGKSGLHTVMQPGTRGSQGRQTGPCSQRMRGKAWGRPVWGGARQSRTGCRTGTGQTRCAVWAHVYSQPPGALPPGPPWTGS